MYELMEMMDNLKELEAFENMFQGNTFNNRRNVCSNSDPLKGLEEDFDDVNDLKNVLPKYIGIAKEAINKYEALLSKFKKVTADLERTN